MLKRELIATPRSIKMEISGQLFGENETICAHSICRILSDSLIRQAPCAFQEPLINIEFIGKTQNDFLTKRSPQSCKHKKPLQKWMD